LRVPVLLQLQDDLLKCEHRKSAFTAARTG
jgi:hypothetical protein